MIYAVWPRHSFPGMIRFMNSSKSGTVNAASPCDGLQTIPFPITPARVGASDETSRPRIPAISPERCGPGPGSAIAMRYRRSSGVTLSNRTKKKLSSSAAMATSRACSALERVIGPASAMSRILSKSSPRDTIAKIDQIQDLPHEHRKKVMGDALNLSRKRDIFTLSHKKDKHTLSPPTDNGTKACI